MKIKTSIGAEETEVSRVDIIIGETHYRITEDTTHKGIRINKIDFNESQLTIKPSVSNDIILI